MAGDRYISALDPGTRLNSYTVERVLGAGAFGITYRAREGVTGRSVAIKEYFPSSLVGRAVDGFDIRLRDEGCREDFAWGFDRFRREAGLLVTIRHPNVVPVLTYFEANATAYIVMEYQEGCSLGSLVRRPQGLLDEAELLEVIAPLLDGLEAVHAKGILHRDIKPDNVFVRRDGTPVLLDFGAARQLPSGIGAILTPVLTEGYAPREQYDPAGNQRPWTDIYAVGALMLRCVSSETLVSAVDRWARTVLGQPDPMAEAFANVCRCVSRRTALAIEIAMTLDEKKRPHTVPAFREILFGESAPAPLRAPENAPTRWSRRFAQADTEHGREQAEAGPEAAARAGSPSGQGARTGSAKRTLAWSALAALAGAAVTAIVLKAWF